MNKIYLEHIVFIGIIITLFFSNSLFITPILNETTNKSSNSSIAPNSSTTQGSSNPTGDEWPMFHCSLNHTGVTETIPVAKEGPIWSYNTGNDATSSPAVANGMVYMGTYDGNIYCLNASTGNFIWKYPTGSPIYSSPAVANEMVYIGCDDCNLYCLNAITGSLVWNYTTGNCVESSPAVANGMVYVGSWDDKLYCLNASTGDLIWNYTTGNWVDSSPAVVNGKVYVDSYDGNFYCLNASTGNFLWKYPTINSIYSSPAIANGIVYFETTALNASNGNLLWKYYTGNWVDSSPAIENGMMYVGGQDDALHCLNASTGDLIWDYTKIGFPFYSSPAIVNGMVYVGNMNDNLYCLNAYTGSLIWNYTTGSDIYSSPAVANGMVYIGSADGNLYCFAMITSPEPPTVPQNLQISTGNSQLILHWNAPSYGGGYAITGYKIYRGTSSSSEKYLETVGNVLNFTDTELTNGLKYYYKISAVTSYGESPMSNEIGALCTGQPGSPQNLQISSKNSQIILQWVPPINDGGYAITGYNIYRSTSSGAEKLLISVENVLNYTDIGLTNGQSYYYQVSAINSEYEGLRSDEIAATPHETPPTSPQNLQLTVNNLNIILSWAPPVDNGGSAITGYIIFRGTSETNMTLLATVGNVSTYTDSPPVPDQTYYYKVLAVNGIGNGDFSQVTDIHFNTMSNSKLPIILIIIGVCPWVAIIALKIRKKI